MEKAEQDLKQAEDLFQKKLISQTEMLAAQTARDVAKSTYESSVSTRIEAGGGRLEPGTRSDCPRRPFFRRSGWDRHDP